MPFFDLKNQTEIEPSTPRRSARRARVSHRKPRAKQTLERRKKESISAIRKKAGQGKVGSRERTINLMKASIASPKTPERLKEALRKKLKEMGE